MRAINPYHDEAVEERLDKETIDLLEEVTKDIEV